MERYKNLVLFVVLLACACVSIGWWCIQGRAVALPDAPDGRVSCVSYAPFHRAGQTPFDKNEFIAPEQIDADLASLSKRFACVRTYSVSQGLDAVPRIAQKYGMQTLMGVWIGRDPVFNEKEIAHAIEVAKNANENNPNSIRAIVVGNEVLLRREQPAAALRAMIERVRNATHLPVTYADVWEFWLKNPELAPAVDFVTIHILPYWEDKPVAIEHAVEHVVSIYNNVQRVFTDKKILIGETGWPSAGRQRWGAVPSQVNQARFFREFLNEAQERALPYNLIEAYDQPWKRALEGTAGGYWGVLDAGTKNEDGHEKFPLQGAVAEDPQWRTHLYLCLGAGALLFSIGLFLRMAIKNAGILFFAGISIATTLLIQWHTVVMASRNLLEWSVSSLYLALAISAALLLALTFVRKMPAHIDKVLAALQLALLFGMAAWCLLLVFDARYRDFPFALYAAPVIGFALRRMSFNPMPAFRSELAHDERRESAFSEPAFLSETKLLAWIILPSALFIAVHETFLNMHALAWSALCLLCGVSVLRSSQNQRAEQ